MPHRGLRFTSETKQKPHAPVELVQLCTRFNSKQWAILSSGYPTGFDSSGFNDVLV